MIRRDDLPVHLADRVLYAVRRHDDAETLRFQCFPRRIPDPQDDDRLAPVERCDRTREAILGVVARFRPDTILLDRTAPDKTDLVLVYLVNQQIGGVAEVPVDEETAGGCDGKPRDPTRQRACSAP